MMKRKRSLWVMLLSLALMLICMPMSAFADDDVIKFDDYVVECTSGSYMFELGSDSCFIHAEVPNGIESAVSSDENVIKINNVHQTSEENNTWELGIDPVGVGKASVKVVDKAGNTKSCSVEVREGMFFYHPDEVSMSVTENSPYLYIHADDLDASSYVSSNPEVAAIESAWSMGAGRCICTLTFKSCGTTTITATDSEGRSASIKLNVTEADWELNTSSLEFALSDNEKAWDALKIVIGNDYADLNAVSSDESVVTAFVNGYTVALEPQGVGEADITVSDNYGKSRVCHVTVNPDPPTPFAFTKTSHKFYYYQGTSEEEWFYLTDDTETAIVSASVDNENVASVELANEGSEGKYYELVVRPVGLGTAVITATDEQGLTAKIKISVIEEIFLDQSYFGSTNASDPGSYDSQAVYGDTALYCHCDYNGTVASCKIGTKTYKGTIKNGKCTIKVPRITTKTISVKFTNGEFSYTSKATVEKKKAAFVKATAASVTYNGKAQSPKVTVKDGSYTLVKGTDYTVTYKNNTKVGTGTATIKLKGNYTGTKTAKFQVKPKGTSIVSLVAAKKSFTVKWNKNTAVNGYDIEYSNQKNFKNVATANAKYAESIRYTKNSVISRKFTGLVSGKTYYVRVRTFKKVSGKYIYSNWSAVKSIKVK